MAADVFSRSVAHKVSRVRWRPGAPGSLSAPTEFATGSWDAQHENKVCVWSLSEDDVTVEPRAVCEVGHRGDVMDLQFVDQRSVMTASSTGDLTVITIRDGGEPSLHTGPRVAVHSSACSSVSVRDGHAVSVGEDGCLAVVDIATATLLRLFEEADCTALHAVCHATPGVVLAVNSLGQLKQWDVRRADTQPTAIMTAPGCRWPLLCVAAHPAQPPVVGVGGKDGTLQMWDTRQQLAPTALMQGHTAEMWDIQFHPAAPENLFTCSQDGTLWHWRVGGGFSHPGSRLGGLPPSSSSGGAVGPPAGGGWLADPTSSGLLIQSLLHPAGAPLNSLDASGSRLVCGGDSEKVFVCTGVSVH